MNGWSDAEKLNVIGTHEKTHEKHGLWVDKDERRGVAISEELISRFQYSILYPESSSDISKWLANYDKQLGNDVVNKAYSSAVNGLVDSGKLTKDAGQKMVEGFNKANVKR